MKRSEQPAFPSKWDSETGIDKGLTIREYILIRVCTIGVDIDKYKARFQTDNICDLIDK